VLCNRAEALEQEGIMNYEDMVRETDMLIRRVMIHNDIMTWVLTAMVAGLVLMLGWLALQEHREKMRQYRAQREWEEMQNQQTYYRM
jgi:hypothetical protein